MRSSGCTSRRPSCRRCQSSTGAPAVSLINKLFAPTEPRKDTLVLPPVGAANWTLRSADTLPRATRTGKAAGT